MTHDTLVLCKRLIAQERIEAERDLRDAEFTWRDSLRTIEAERRLERASLAETEINEMVKTTPGMTLAELFAREDERSDR